MANWITSVARALVVAAHPDDEVLGCGGLIVRLLEVGVEVRVLILSGATTSRASDVAVSANITQVRNEPCPELALAMSRLGVTRYEQLHLADNRFDCIPLLDLVRAVEARQASFEPDLVLCHDASDLNVDHQRVHQACITAFRPLPGSRCARLLSFEIPSSTEYSDPSLLRFSPNSFVDVTSVLSRKLEALSAYASELRAYPHPRSLEAVSLRAKIRGVEVGLPAAEAFRVIRDVAR